MIQIGTSLARATLGAVAHLSWWVAFQARAKPMEGSIVPTPPQGD
jgi:hypothetical protein